MTVLLLAGTQDAAVLADALLVAQVTAVASLARPMPRAMPLALPTRIGGFGDADGFATYLRAAGITKVLDATHPFATRMTARSLAVCRTLGLPYLCLARVPWVAGPGDDWRHVATEAEAATLIPPGSTVFLGTEHLTLDRFATLAGRRVICRVMDPPTAPFPFDGGEFLIGRPPFSVAQERDLFAALGVGWMVVRNAGGEASRTKLTAARDLGIPVVMIRRPPQPDAPVTDDMAAAVAWAAGR
ncbi:precorrin-6A/cobalt-precorrin-6A reductase [Loktanella fryxellensis]|uniref:Precorrin-6A/cobalt-precorrin-6A reductase n=1 Tax=Loktanella fryxellensis TaxID=245187 RepID=A0A1H8BEU1_9RHOB|nr:precorrin-6A/cobalt-precorrin-6A reductase [Loktanella fryxellensis]SEM81343.1 precorrin-6A/cobalt-precorrin-6A reductase [Loktanella fryxellensis]